MRRTIVVIAAVALLSACSSTPTPTATEAPAPAPTSAPAARPAPTPAAAVVATETEAQKLERIIRTLAANSIYFDYDDYTIKAQYQDLLKQDYEFLKSSPQVKATLTGHGDERGSAEYNLALGQKRAEAVAQALRVLGVPEAQMEAVSYGEEMPRASCHEEKCWAENRRVDFSFRKPGDTK